MPNLTIDQVTDNGNNSLTIVGHTDDGTEYISTEGCKSDVDARHNEADQLTYYKDILSRQLPAEQPILYQTPEYAAQLEQEAADEAAAEAAANNDGQQSDISE